jgi:hypothetical protein
MEISRLRDWFNDRPTLVGTLTVGGVVLYLGLAAVLGVYRFVLVGVLCFWFWFTLKEFKPWWKALLVFAVTSPLAVLLARVAAWTIHAVGQP